MPITRLRSLKLPLALLLTVLLLTLSSAGLLAAAPVSPQGQTQTHTLILEGADMDSWINQALPQTNYGIDEELEVGRESVGPNPANLRSLLWFDLSPLHYGAQVISATLELYQVDASGPAIYFITPMAIFDTWDEDTVTWANQPSAFEMEDPSVPLDAFDGWKQWDVTYIVRNWGWGEIDNYGIMLRGDNDTIGSRVFVATDSDQYPELLPRLTIVYTAPPPFVVNSPFDVSDVSPGDGICEASASQVGQCTLRAAIQEANALPGANDIFLPSGAYTLTIRGEGEDNAATGDLDILDFIFIEGDGSDSTFINGNGLDTVFHILPDGSLLLYDVTIHNGNGREDAPGGLRNDGFAHLEDCVIRNNAAASIGGGIANHGILTVNRCQIIHNTAQDYGGGVFNGYAEATIHRSQIMSNTSQFDGGGLYNTYDAMLEMDRSAVAFNQASGSGGGLYNGGLATVDNSTFSGNTATSGGGVYQTAVPSLQAGQAVQQDVALNLNNATVAFNTANSAGGGLASATDGVIRIQNTLVGQNTSQTTGPDCRGVLHSGGYNLIQDTTGCVLQGETQGNRTGIEPGLSALGQHGGATPTHALLPGSPAIDAGRPAAANTAAWRCTPHDQRSIIRPQGDHCDIGAFEVEVGDPQLTINYPTGRPGSYFTVAGSKFPAEEMATIYLNGVVIGYVDTDAAGEFVFIIATIRTMPEGKYIVTAEVNPIGRVFFGLDQEEPLHGKEGDGPVLDVPGGIQPAHSAFMPMFVR